MWRQQAVWQVCLGRWGRLGGAGQIGERLEVQIYVGNRKVSEVLNNFKGKNGMLDMDGFNIKKRMNIFLRYVYILGKWENFTTGGERTFLII